MMEFGSDAEILLEIQNKYKPYLKKLISFLEKNKKATGEQLKRLKSIYAVFTSSSEQDQINTFKTNKKKLEKWYQSSQKDKMQEDSILSSKRSLEEDTDSSQGDTLSIKKSKNDVSAHNVKVEKYEAAKQVAIAPRITIPIVHPVVTTTVPQGTIENANEKITFPCASCQYYSTDEQEFMKHTRTDHRSDLSMWCKHCGKCFSNAGVLVTHIKEKACTKEEMIYRCGVKDCTFETGSGQTFVHHLRHCHKGSPFIFCVHCQKIFTLPHCLILHMQDDCPHKEKNRKNPESMSQATPQPPLAATAPIVRPNVPSFTPATPSITAVKSMGTPVLAPTPVVQTNPIGRGSLLPSRGRGRGRGRSRGRGRGRMATDSSDSDDPDDPSWRPEETPEQPALRRSGRWAKRLSDVVNVESSPASKSLSMTELNSKKMLQCPCCDFMAAFKSVLGDHYIAHHKVANKNSCSVCMLKFESTQEFIEHFEDHMSGKLSNVAAVTDSSDVKSTGKTSSSSGVNGGKVVEVENEDSSELMAISTEPSSLVDNEPYEGVVKNITEAESNSNMSGNSNYLKIPYQSDNHDKDNKDVKFKLFEQLKSPSDLKDMKTTEKLKCFYKCSLYSCTFTVHDHTLFETHLISFHKGKQAYCSYCLKCLPADETLTNHMIAEHSKRQYQCSNCFYRGYSKMHVKIHINNYHAKDKSAEIYVCEPITIPKTVQLVTHDVDALKTTWPYVCAVGDCNFQTFDPKEFLNHNNQLHQSVSVYYCHYCKVNFISFQRLFSHYRLHGVSIFQCNYCIHGAELKSSILLHLCNYHPDLPLQAFMRGSENDVSPETMLVPFELQKKPTENEKNMNNQINSVAKDKESCPFSEIDNKNRIDFEVLLYEVVGETYYPKYLRKLCTDLICGISYCSEKNENILTYIGHLKNAHAIVNFPCPHCAHVSETWEAFKNHLLSHGPDLYGCGLVTCGFYDPDKHIAMNHLKNHNHSSAKVIIIREENSSECEIDQVKSLPSCPFTIPKESYTCVFCKYKSSNKKIMKNHLYLELFYKRFTCDLCKVKLVSRKEVQQHFESFHVGHHMKFSVHPKPEIETKVHQILQQHDNYIDSELNKCSMCSKNFKAVDQFQRHLQLCVQNHYQPYDCEYCKESFTDLLLVKYHIDENHPLENIKYSEVTSPDVEYEIGKNLQYLRFKQIIDTLGKDITDKTSQFYSGKIYKCGKCSYVANHKSMVNNHFRNTALCSGSEIIKSLCEIDVSKIADSAKKEDKVKDESNQSNETKQLFCVHCSRKLQNHQELEDHVESIHSIDGKYYYYYCPDANDATLADDKEKYECAYCKSGKESLSQLKVHSELMHSEMQFKVKGIVARSRDCLSVSACGYCFYRLVGSNEIKSHLANNHASLPQKRIKGFRDVLKKRDDADDLPNKRVRFGDNVFVCGHCGAVFSSHDLIVTHAKKAHSRLPTDIKKICPSVDKEYSNTTFYKCEFCQFTSERQYLEPHLSSKHKLRVTCGHCNKRFEFATKAREHHEIAHKDLPVKYSQETVGTSVSKKDEIPEEMPVLEPEINSTSIKKIIRPKDSSDCISLTVYTQDCEKMSLESYSEKVNIYPFVSLDKITL